ncbi:hypothetical protein PybrP1_007491 [[Pythium] brassicae (nom. inval.)]|nr:hypothetical protein PybrP1_007491 [[Pythium] brassicae (nom. inval.)]
MKLFVPVLALALVLLAAPAAADTEYVTFNYDIARSYAGTGVSFLEVDSNPLPGSLLMGMGSYSNPPPPPPPATVPCSTSPSTTVSGDVTVLIAISKCLTPASVKTIEDWAKGLQASQKTFFQRGTTANIQFAVASVPGSCQSLSEAEAHGQSLLAAEDDAQRLAGFSKFARVLDALPSSTPTETITSTNPSKSVTAKEVPIAVVSFVDSYSSFETVQQYELTEKISTTFNFRICEKGENCDTKFENCINLDTAVDVFMYSPFKVTSTFNCASLTGGIPVTYVDNTNARQCACTCPTGTVMSADKTKCTTVAPETCKCVWASAPNGGYTKEIKSCLTKCEFTSIATGWNIPVPVPIDNYVAKDRVNRNDAPGYLSLKDGPHIDLATVRIGDPVYNIDGATGLPYSLPNAMTPSLEAKLVRVVEASAPTVVPTPYSWKEYQSNRADKVDKFKYTAYGKYKLALAANDYNASATCEGCIAIVDKFRPQATTTCPKIICDKSTSDCTDDEGVVELTSANVARVETQIKKFFEYQDLADNDACSTSTRCDDDKIKRKNFLEASYSGYGANYRTDGAAFYSVNAIKADFASKVGGKVLSTDLVSKETPVEYGKCTRCIDLSTELREKWTDFKCGRDYDVERCEGKGGECCGVKQCVVAFGDTIAVASAKINDNTVTSTRAVLAELAQQGYNAETQIHVALQCTKFKDLAYASADADEKCSYKAKISDLIDVKAEKNTASIFTDSDATKYVSWRYRIDTQSWKEWDKCDEYTFDKAETKVTIEAWTKCGIVRKFYFYVDLHLNSPVAVCDNFRSMWYQTTNAKLAAPNDLCTYPRSDFAELTFDYHANIGLQYSPDRLTMNVSNVVCRLNYVGLTGAPATIVDTTKISPEIVTRFAVLAQRAARTAALTPIHVTCDFTYKRYNTQEPLKQTCNQDFFLTDCSGPEIDRPCPLDNKDCPADKCIGNANPAPYEACGGNIVSASGQATVITRAVDKTCCEFCPENYVTTCKTIAQLPTGENDIKRCEPAPKTSGGPSLLAATSQTSSGTLASADKSVSGGAATVLLSASAMVALVALVVVKRRRNSAAAAPAAKDMMEDAYYPLLN